MAMADFNLYEAVSFWGGIASIIALAIPVVGGVVALYRMLARSSQAELERLEKTQAMLIERTRAATTQGKRMDLFIYKESMFSSLRFRYILLEIAVATFDVIGFLFLIFIFSLDRNADYASDHVLSFGNNWRDSYPTICFASIFIVVFGMIDTRRRLRRKRRHLEKLSSAFVSELAKIIEDKLPIEDYSDNKAVNPSGGSGGF